MYKGDERRDYLKKNGNIQKLQQLTDELPSLSKFIKAEHEEYIEYKSEGDGTFMGFGLYTNSDVSVQRVFLSKGTIVSEHTHKEREWGMVYKGKVLVRYRGEEHEYDVGSCLFCEVGESHSGIALEDTWVMFVTIPAGEGYPDAKR